jgi:hypothetical protein
MVESISMRTLALIFLILPCRALAEPSSHFYVGESTVTLDGGRVVKHPYLAERKVDEAASTVEESVVSHHREGYAEHQLVSKIAGDAFTVEDPAVNVTGKGELTGAPWHWTFLRAEFHAPGLRLVDYNFLAEPRAIYGHKDFYRPKDGGGETLWMQEDVVLHEVNESQYRSKREELLRKP